MIDEPSLRRDQLDNEHLRLLIAFTLAHDSNCIDIGAHRGSALAQMVRCAPIGRHIAYEPLPEFHEDLVRRFPTVDVRRNALSNEARERPFTYVPSLPDFSGFRRRTYPSPVEVQTISVEAEPLDESLPEGFVPALIKIDVEGAEREVIEGGIETIAKHKPTVVFEHGRGAAEHYGTRPEHVFELLAEEAGLRLFDIDGNGPFDLAEFSEVFEHARIWNFVAHR